MFRNIVHRNIAIQWTIRVQHALNCRMIKSKSNFVCIKVWANRITNAQIYALSSDDSLTEWIYFVRIKTIWSISQPNEWNSNKSWTISRSFAAFAFIPPSRAHLGRKEKFKTKIVSSSVRCTFVWIDLNVYHDGDISKEYFAFLVFPLMIHIIIWFRPNEMVYFFLLVSFLRMLVVQKTNDVQLGGREMVIKSVK